MNFEIQTSSYFDAEAKRLAKRHRSFVDDLQDFRDNILKNPYQGTELSPSIRKVRLTIGLDLQALQSEGKLKAAEIKKEENGNE